MKKETEISDEELDYLVRSVFSEDEGRPSKVDLDLWEVAKRWADDKGIEELQQQLDQLQVAIEAQDKKLGLILDILSSTPKPEGMWGVKEAAEKLGLSQPHLRLLLNKGEVKGEKVGGTWVVLDLSYIRKRREGGGRK